MIPQVSIYISHFACIEVILILISFSNRLSLLDSRCGRTELRRPFTPPPRYREAIDYEGTEWSIAEDYEALMVINLDSVAFLNKKIFLER